MTRAIKIWIVLLAATFLASPSFAAEKPTVRAITAFVRLDHAQYQKQIAGALVMLRSAKAAYQKAGYEVQTLRIATQPFGEYIAGLTDAQALAFFREYAALARKEQFTASIGPAMHLRDSPAREAELLGEILRTIPDVSASLTVADGVGVRWSNVSAAARIIKMLSERTPGGIGNFSFAATALVPSNTPFYPAAYHTGPGRQFAIGLQSANVVIEAVASHKSQAEAEAALSAQLGNAARDIEAIALQVAKQTGWAYTGIDLSPAPMKEVSMGTAVEKFSGAKFGSAGTMTAAASITRVLKTLPVKQAGYSGLMVPVLEDSVLAERWSEGLLTLDALLAYSAVCGTGLDTVPLPGDATVEQLERIIGDVAALAVKLRKPLSARLMPVAGKKAGERSAFDDPFLVNAVLQPLR